ncbi:hypothetical protein POM88_027876 [Heracleum sosnowskyi]|uniref:Uncharacterized protein n=1 Tax=Heracleum sosnowskyi TaxID=360622 RepID=A0AAD8IAU5_9APIA|nr:hypothetical protein POM88_027876 [Heracleum sosnowskyi]
MVFMSSSSAALQLLIWIALILLMASLASAIGVDGRIGDCYEKCKDLDMACNDVCKDEGQYMSLDSALFVPRSLPDPVIVISAVEAHENIDRYRPKMENMSFSFIAKKLVIWISLILLIVSLVSAISENGTLGDCFGKCAKLGTDCDEFCRASGYSAGTCFLKDCCCIYG